MAYNCDRCHLPIQDEVSHKIHYNKHKFWCHFCELDLQDFEHFRIHIMEKHRPSSLYYEDKKDCVSNLSHPLHLCENKDKINNITQMNLDKSENLNDQSCDAIKPRTDKNIDAVKKNDEILKIDDVKDKNFSKIKSKALDSSEIQGSKFQCKSCHMKLLSISCLKDHKCVKMSKIVCNMCQMQFSEKTELDRHLFSTHKIPEYISVQNPSDVNSSFCQSILNPCVNAAPVQYQLIGMASNIVDNTNNSQMTTGCPIVGSQPNIPIILANLPTSIPDSSLDYNSEKFIKLSFKFLKTFRSLKYPLPSRLLKKIMLMHDATSKKLNVQKSEAKEDVAMKQLHKLLENAIAKHYEATV